VKKLSETIELDIAGLIADAGGAAEVAKLLGIARTVPYSWIARGTLQLSRVAAILSAKPRLKIEDYVIRPGGSTDDPEVLAKQVMRLTKRLHSAMTEGRKGQ